MNEKIFITTSIAYPNARPHIGYALELAQADFLARYYQQRGHSVRLLTGVDEHGLKLQQAAARAGVSPADFVASESQLFQDLADRLDISYDRYIHTTDADHVAMAQAIWRACAKSGDIYRERYSAWYDVKEEEFLGRVDAYPDPSVFNKDPKFIEKIDEENYFFRLSRYRDRIVELLRSGALNVTPASRAKEILNFVAERGLQDVSISRDASKLNWGVPVPDDSGQVMYVWFDALTNYLTAAADLTDSGIVPGEYWPPTLHCIGYDIQRFHALIWPGMLLSASLPLPTELLVHGFITDERGQKMSKSVGNVIDPLPLLQKFGSDPVRWYLLKEVSTTVDTKMRLDHIDEVYASDLANTFGNLVSRMANMIGRYCDGRVPAGEPIASARTRAAAAWEQYDGAVRGRDIQAALRAALDLLTWCNQLVEQHQPWKLAKQPDRAAELNDLLATLAETVRQAALMMAPAMPVTAAKLGWLLGNTSRSWSSHLTGTSVPAEPVMLFPRLND